MNNNLITDGQRFAIVRLCSKFADVRPARLYLLSKLTGRNITTSAELLLEEWRKIRNEAYPNWSSNDWSICKGFESKCREILEQYETEVLGQKRLFE